MNLDRRQLLRCLCFLPALGLARSPARARAQGTERHLALNVFSVAGFQYYRGPELLPSFVAGQPLSLIAEPKNAHDEFAVRIEWRGQKIGYVPRSDNKHLSRLLHQQIRLEGRIAEVRENDAPWRTLKVEVGMRG